MVEPRVKAMPTWTRHTAVESKALFVNRDVIVRSTLAEIQKWDTNAISAFQIAKFTAIIHSKSILLLVSLALLLAVLGLAERIAHCVWPQFSK